MKVKSVKSLFKVPYAILDSLLEIQSELTAGCKPGHPPDTDSILHVGKYVFGDADYQLLEKCPSSKIDTLRNYAPLLLAIHTAHEDLQDKTMSPDERVGAVIRLASDNADMFLKLTNDPDPIHFHARARLSQSREYYAPLVSHRFGEFGYTPQEFGMVCAEMAATGYELLKMPAECENVIRHFANNYPEADVVAQLEDWQANAANHPLCAAVSGALLPTVK